MDVGFGPGDERSILSRLWCRTPALNRYTPPIPDRAAIPDQSSCKFPNPGPSQFSNRAVAGRRGSPGLDAGICRDADAR